MFAFVLSFSIGIFCLQFFAMLPSLSFFWTLVFPAGVGIFTRSLYPFGFILGFCWAFYSASDVLKWSLPENLQNQPIIVSGFVSEIPYSSEYGTKIMLKLDNSNANLSLLDSNNLEIHVGQHWQFESKLKRIHGTHSPGAFDYEAWAFENHIRAQGKIIADDNTKLLDDHWYVYSLQRVRAIMKNKIETYSMSPWLLALMIGERHELTKEDWALLRATGTNHLFAIAGLHIGILASIIYGLFKFIWSRIPRAALYIPTQHAAAFASLLLSIIYSLLSGLSLPTQRACLMLVLYSLILLRKKDTNRWNIWGLTVLILLLINPLTVLSESFWLSIVTIALIIYLMEGRVAPKGWWWKYGRVQVGIAIGLVPLSMLYFHQISIIAFVSNLIAIPIITIILPLCLLADVFLNVPIICKYIIVAADFLIDVMIRILQLLSAIPWATYHIGIPNYLYLILSLLAIVLMLAPRGFPARYLGVIWLLPIFTYTKKIEPNTLQISILDVGQGLATVVRTANHNLIYDTGPAYTQGDAGESVVLPYLYSQGIHNVDMMVISHGDNDHMGGATSILKNISVHSILTSVPAKISTPITSFCKAGTKWQWDGIDFELLYPYKAPPKSKNDYSCVLKITDKNKSILLPGDIENAAEKNLVKYADSNLQSTIQIAPHHGSKTSIQSSYLKLVKPEYVIYSYGYLNRYHFPHPSVTDIYTKLQSRQINTVDSGTITFQITNNDINIEKYTEILNHYWDN